MELLTAEQLKELQDKWRISKVETILSEAISIFGKDYISFATALGAEGIVILHHLYQMKADIEIFILDTGLLFPETYALKEHIEKTFGIKIKTYSGISLKEQEQIFGKRLWYRNPDLCCFIRKVLPLKKALDGKKAWITSIRREQSLSRANTETIMWDNKNNLYKVNPLAYWTWEQVWDYIKKYNLPYNPLHDKGYPSIGCMPCTTPVYEGEDWRAGRWRGLKKKECGIHQ